MSRTIAPIPAFISVNGESVRCRRGARRAAALATQPAPQDIARRIANNEQWLDDPMSAMQKDTSIGIFHYALSMTVGASGLLDATAGLPNLEPNIGRVDFLRVPPPRPKTVRFAAGSISTGGV